MTMTYAIDCARADASTLTRLVREHSPDTTTDSESFGGVGGRVIGRRFQARTLRSLLAAARRRVRALRGD